jgi:hypothetical protein
MIPYDTIHKAKNHQRIMINQRSEITRFNRKLDGMVENVMNHNDFEPEFTREYVEATNLYRRVAEYDVQLAQELLSSTLLFAYYFAVAFDRHIRVHNRSNCDLPRLADSP